MTRVKRRKAAGGKKIRKDEATANPQDALAIAENGWQLIVDDVLRCRNRTSPFSVL